jgi:hypothetical protein
MVSVKLPFSKLEKSMLVTNLYSFAPIFCLTCSFCSSVSSCFVKRTAYPAFTRFSSICAADKDKLCFFTIKCSPFWYPFHKNDYHYLLSLQARFLAFALALALSN